jgi:DNA polymerase III epsilon subunit-like protein
MVLGSSKATESSWLKPQNESLGFFPTYFFKVPKITDAFLLSQIRYQCPIGSVRHITGGI